MNSQPPEKEVIKDGAGSLCGKSLSKANSSTIGAEKLGNWSLSNLSEEQFVKELLEDQLFVPKSLFKFYSTIFYASFTT